MKSLFRVLTLAVMALAIWPSAHAVTKSEMDKARLKAAKLYVRHSNNMAGYLDEVDPESFADLERALKNETDRANLQTFMKASVASDYAGWNKEQLVAYWSGEFLNSNKSVLKAETADNNFYRAKVRGAVQSIKVADPVPEEEAAPEPEPEPQPMVQEQPQMQQELPVEDQNIQTNEELAAEDEAMAATDSTIAADEAAGGQTRACMSPYSLSSC